MSSILFDLTSIYRLPRTGYGITFHKTVCMYVHVLIYICMYVEEKIIISIRRSKRMKYKEVDDW